MAWSRKLFDTLRSKRRNCNTRGRSSRDCVDHEKPDNGEGVSRNRRLLSFKEKKKLFDKDPSATNETNVLSFGKCLSNKCTEI